MTAQIADALMQHLQPQGSLVVIEAEHMCMKMRGVRKTQPVMSTIAHRGVFTRDAGLRQEVLSRLLAGAGKPLTSNATVEDRPSEHVNEDSKLYAFGDADVLRAAR